MNILVTGAAGFIGSFVVRRFAERGDTVTGLDNINDYYDPELKFARLAESGIAREDAEKWYKFAESTLYGPNYRFIRMNLEDKEAMKMLFANGDFDAVVNLGAQAGVRYSITNPQAYIESNIDGFINVLEGVATMASSTSSTHRRRASMASTARCLSQSMTESPIP